MALCALTVLVAVGAVSPRAHAQCNIYMGTNQQVIDGFGFSSAWCGQLSTAKNNSLYGTLGMSILRVRIDDNNYWSDEAANAAAAHAVGAKVFGTAWSGPAAWIDTQQSMDGSLRPQYYADYANWLGQAASALNLDWVSPANEPDLGWMSWTSDQLRTWIGQYGAGIGRPMLAPESCWFADSYGNPILDDPKAGTNVVIYGGHYYGNGPAVHQDALNKGKHVWMTEYYFDGPNDLGVCMQIAQQINDSMNCQLSAYIWWWDNDSDTNTVLVTSDGAINKNGYTMGQFAKWIRPGSTRVTADYKPASGVSVTAYNVNGSAVIVAVNTNTTGSVNQSFAIHNGSAAVLEGYCTSSSQSMADMGSFAVSNGSFTANLPAQSITTFVQTNGAPANLPSPWSAQDIGAVGVVGSTGYTNSAVTNGGFTVTASGGDIGNPADAFRFVFETNGGDCTILARVSSEQSTNAWSKGGVMIRESLATNAANALMAVTPSNGVTFQYRSSTGGGSVSNNVTSLSAPYWVKLVRSGNSFAGYCSPDGASWTQVGSATFTMASTAYVGLAVTAHNNSSWCTAAFDNVSAPGWPVPPPSVPTGLTATTGIEQVILNWQAGGYATSNNVGRATVSGGPYTTIATVRGTGYIDANLVGGTTYYYVVKALNGAGQSTNSAPVGATPTANVPSPWVAQDLGFAGVVGTKGLAGSESLSNGVFTVAGSGDDIWGTSDGCRFVGVTNGGNCTIIARVAALEVPTNVTIDVWSKAGVMIRSSLASNAPNAFIAVTPSNGVAWQTRSTTGGSTVNAATTGLTAPYWVKLVRSGNVFTGFRSPDGTNWTQQGSTTITMSSPVYVGLAVAAHNSSGMVTVTFDNVTAPGWPPPLPPPPAGLVVASGMEHATLNWLASSNATSYNVKRSMTNGGPYTIAASVTTTNCTDSGLTSGTTYYYVVSAANAGGESADSDQASATPTAAAKLTGTIIGTAGSWSSSGNTIAKVFDNNLTTFFDGPDANGDWAGLDFGVGVSNVITRIKYCPRSGFESRMVGGVFQGANQADFSDAVTLATVATQPATGVFTSVSVSSAAAFRYVRYLSPNGGFGNVAEVEFYGYQFTSAPVLPAPGGLMAAAVSSSQINLVWNGLPNAASYNVKRSTTSGGSYTVVVTGVTATNYTDSILADGTTYFYVVSAVNLGGESANSVPASATTMPAAPAGLTAVAVSATQIGLTWNAVTTATGYRVKRSTTSGGPYTPVATGVAPTSYTDTGLLNGTTYYYVVSALNLAGESTNSSPVGVTTKTYLVGTVTLGNLRQTYDGTAKSVTATTTPSGLTVNITYNGSASAPTNAGSYTVIGTINDANYQGGATNTLVINDAIPPQMGVALTGANLTLSWPLASTGFTLQSCTNLALGTWVDVPSPVPQVVGSNWLVTLPRPVDNSSVFYRLSK
jgi:glucuronoarabinoxylan endo-1,4-beta-xylanase